MIYTNQQLHHQAVRAIKIYHSLFDVEFGRKLFHYMWLKVGSPFLIQKKKLLLNFKKIFSIKHLLRKLRRPCKSPADLTICLNDNLTLY